MTSVDVELALVALGAMLSPTTLSVSVLALVLGKRPLRTGLWFYLGALSATLAVGVLGAFVIGDLAAPADNSSTPPTAVAIIDIVAGLLVLIVVYRWARRPQDPERAAHTVEQMGRVADSSAIAIVAAGATLANPGGFIPLALKEISQTNPSNAEFVLAWVGFALVSLLPLALALLALFLARERTERVLEGARAWLERNARMVAAVLLILLAVALLRNGIVALAG
jgi:hypothetical protein